MKVTRGRTFEKDGAWEKLEVELTTEDLLPTEAALEAHLQPLLLEIRADQQLVSFTHRLGEMSDEDMGGSLDVIVGDEGSRIHLAVTRRAGKTSVVVVEEEGVRR